jgi:hypothetical protein
MEMKTCRPGNGLNGLRDGKTAGVRNAISVRIFCAVKWSLFVLTLLVVTRVCAMPSYVATFHSIGLYWAPPGGGPDKTARVEFRAAGTSAWRAGLALWFDERSSEYRGSLVELQPGTTYAVRLTLDGGFTETINAATWSEKFRIKRTIHIKPGATNLIIDASDSGDERAGYVVFTAPPGQNVIDQSTASGDATPNSCIVVRQGAHHVIIRGLVLRNCKRHAVFIERESNRVLDATTQHIVIEDNEISGWGGHGHHTPGRADGDGAIHCNYFREHDPAKKPSRIVVQRNRIYNPRHGANPWQTGSAPRVHPHGPQAVTFSRCGSNHVFRYNEIYSTNGNHFNDAIGGGDNFSTEGFPWADSDIYGNRISDVYDDAVEAEGANRNVRIWGNYFDRVFVAIGNAATALGPLYVWRNVADRMANMYNPYIHPDLESRGPFVKAGSNAALANGGRAYYFHNTALQRPPVRGESFSLGAGGGILNSGGMLYNLVSRNNIWHIHKEPLIDGQPKFYSIRADCNLGPCDADFDAHNGGIANAGARAEAHGWGPGARGRPVYAASGTSYPAGTRQGEFSLAPGSPGHQGAEPIPNFNDAYARPDVGAHQSGTPSMRFGLAAGKAPVSNPRRMH